jgi:hypothetical protein
VFLGFAYLLKPGFSFSVKKETDIVGLLSREREASDIISGQSVQLFLLSQNPRWSSRDKCL